MRKVSDTAARFQKFVGHVVACTEVTRTMEFKALGLPPQEFTHAEYDENDPTIQKIKQMVGSARLRIFTPGRDIGTCDYQPDRLNVSIVKDADGTFKVARITNG